ncbi:MAG: ammonia-forming cytochrome c nitrite reductase subunit c552 [Kiritimatiellae bacterium]|nr:ammonia-forming cytochrome c nitrite reductase subunit c552 [Kiritimatiellia bacterium]
MLQKMPSSSPSRLRAAYVVTVSLAAAATIGAMALWRNIMERKAEARQRVFQIVELNGDTIDPAEWGKNYPRQYDSYRRTVDTERTRHGGSEAFQKLDADPLWRILFQGYAFAVDYREERGHAYMLSDQEQTERVKQFKQPGACLHCHASIIPAYREMGRKAGVPDARPQDQIMKGFEAVCALSYAEARNLTGSNGDKLIQHPVACIDCHDPASMGLRVTRPGLLNGLRELAKADTPLPHLPSVMHWRAGNRVRDYDVNADASRQELRTLVCAQCHVEYYFKGPEKRLTYPWHKGIRMDEIESYYDAEGFADWNHEGSGAKMLKAQHPEFETWSQGIHARSGVSCADCHMPYLREGAVKISDHHVRSPLLSPSRSCQTCHRYPEKEIMARAEAIQGRTAALMLRAEQATVGLIRELSDAQKSGATDSALQAARALHRQAQWRLDFVAAENSMGFHAPQESARILAEAIDLALRGRIELLKPGEKTN